MTIQLNGKTPTKIVRWHNGTEQAVEKIVIFPDGVTEKQIRPPEEPWTPGADTVAYYPFISDYNDYSGNNYHVTNTGSTSLVTFNGVKCLNLNNSMCQVGTIDTMTSSSNYTMMAWLYCLYLNKQSSFYYRENGSWGGGGFHIGSDSYNQVRWGNTTNRYSQISNPGNQKRVHFALVALNGVGSIYVNGVQTILLSSGVIAPNHNGTPFYIGGAENGAIASNGYVSKFIIEKKGWTTQEIQNYFNKTKSLYGIS